MMHYLTIAGQCQHEIEIKHSRFIATAVPIDSYDSGLQWIATIKRRYPDATHNCYAMVADKAAQQCKYSDDGEPSGTAGMPILEVLRHRAIRHTLVVVTRYFGGIKLGTGGLVGAYTQATGAVLDVAHIITMRLSRFYRVEVGFELADVVAQVLRQTGAYTVSVDYGMGVCTHCAVPLEGAAAFAAKMEQATKGRAVLAVEKEDYICYDGNSHR